MPMVALMLWGADGCFGCCGGVAGTVRQLNTSTVGSHPQGLGIFLSPTNPMKSEQRNRGDIIIKDEGDAAF